MYNICIHILDYSGIVLGTRPLNGDVKRFAIWDGPLPAGVALVLILTFVLVLVLVCCYVAKLSQYNSERNVKLQERLNDP